MPHSSSPTWVAIRRTHFTANIPSTNFVHKNCAWVFRRNATGRTSRHTFQSAYFLWKNINCKIFFCEKNKEFLFITPHGPRFFYNINILWFYNRLTEPKKSARSNLIKMFVHFFIYIMKPVTERMIKNISMIL